LPLDSLGVSHFPLIAKLAREQTWPRDPFDRIIVGLLHSIGTAY